MTALQMPAVDPRGPVCLRWRGARIDLRSGVEFRQRSLRDGVALYLSLYPDEIDERELAFRSVSASCAFPLAAEHLELTDAALFVTDGELWIARGAACTLPLYWCTDRSSTWISTSLPLRSSEPFSRNGLAISIATASLNGSYEPNAYVETPLERWRRIRRGSVARLRKGTLHAEQPLRCAVARGEQPSRTAIVEQVRTAFDAFGRSQRRVRASVLEVSGGFDSTLAAASIADRREMFGISAAFPYYEFRFESPVQEAVASCLGVPRLVLDGERMFPYAPSATPPKFDEPSVFVTGICHAERVARLAAGRGAQCIYMGHGGDQCFSTDLTAPEQLVQNPLVQGPFSREAWRILTAATQAIGGSPWSRRELGTFVYDARQDIWIKETFGPTIRTPFSDLAVFRSAYAWSRWCAERGIRPDKSILAEALADRLPDAVRHRKGKVAYDGVWLRAYTALGGHIAGTFERCAPVLSFLGISVPWLVARTRALSAWQPASDREVLAVYALAVWLNAREIQRPQDVPWA